jgi:outer membrane protein OmpA-like peptidoglycan-associated protein
MTSIQKIEVQANYFGFGKNILQPADMASLDLIATELKANPTYKLEISGFADETEIAKGEVKPIYADMDKKRIATVKQYLKDKGIAETRMIEAPKGNSEQNPDINEVDEEDLKMAKNRRVTFKVIK